MRDRNKCNPQLGQRRWQSVATESDQYDLLVVIRAGAQTSLSVIDAFDRAAVDDVRTGRPLNGRVNPRRS